MYALELLAKQPDGKACQSDASGPACNSSAAWEKRQRKTIHVIFFLTPCNSTGQL